jgi:dTMP kinase
VALLIDIEGIDGSGKGTQARRLCDRLVQSGVSTSLISFPRYQETLFGRAIGEFLNGDYGTLEQVHPFLVSLLFAGDRFESKPLLEEALEASEVVVLDRYVPSNVAHQASKCQGPARADLTKRILELEFEVFRLPRPDLVLLLDLPVPMAQELVLRKAARSYTHRPADLQEADGAYLQRVREVYLELARHNARWQSISVCTGDRLRGIDEVSEEIWAAVTKARNLAPKLAR